MKKTLKNIALLIIMIASLVLLTGCGGDKIVATKATEDEMMGNYTEEVIVTFKNKKIDGVEMSMEFDSEEKAEGMYGLYNMGVSMAEDDSLSGLNVELSGKKIVIKMDASEYIAQEGINEEEITKDAIKEALEEDGYTVK